MDKFINYMGDEIDLDNIINYPQHSQNLNLYGLWIEAWRTAGQGLFYLQFLNNGIDYSEQVIKVNKLCQELVDLNKEIQWEDTKENRLKYLKWIYRFEDETENFC